MTRTPIWYEIVTVWERKKLSDDPLVENLVYGPGPPGHPDDWWQFRELRASAIKDGREYQYHLRLPEQLVEAAVFDLIAYSWREMESKMREAMGEAT